MATFGERLRELRKEKDLSQEELGQILSVTQSAIAYYEADKKQPDHEMLKKIADFFNVPLDYLLGREKVELINIDGNKYTPEQIEEMVRWAIRARRALREINEEPED